MHWVIQEKLAIEPAFESLICAVERFGESLQLVDVVPFVGDVVQEVVTDDKVICFGPFSMRHFAKSKQWNPGIYDIEWFGYDQLVDCLGDRVLNHDAVFGKFGEIQTPLSRFFIRPTDDGKDFSGTVKTQEEFRKWRQQVADTVGSDGIQLDTETEVMIAPLKTIYNERRFFVVGGKVVTGSMYKLGPTVVYGETDQYVEVAQEFANLLAKKINHPYVLDIGLTDVGYQVVELNTLNCAGFYAADMQKLVHALIDYESYK